MGPKAEILFAIVSILVFSSTSVAAGKAASADASADQGKATLTYDSGRKVTCLTPRWASGGSQMNTKGSSGKASIGGKSVPVAGWKSGAGYRIGLDVNGDGIVNTEEYRKVAAGGSVVLTGKVGEKELSIRCSDVFLHYDEKKGEVHSMRWRMQGVYGWVGKVAATDVRILDENLDGKYGNDGRDAIQIGKSRLALPLRKQHRIGDDFYTLKVAPDGSSLEFKKIKDVQVGLVRTPFVGRYLLGLVLDGAQGAFDIQACSRTGIPAGTYDVSYGVVGNPKFPAALFRGRNDMLKYEIQADKRNTLRIGPPMQLVFWSEFKQEERNKNKNKNKNAKPAKTTKTSGQTVSRIGVRRPDRVIGAGGEEYGPVTFPNARSSRGRPMVQILQGGRTLAKTIMAEKDGRIQDFWYELPRKFSAQSIRVIMVANVPGLGKITGVRTLKQIYNREPVVPPKTDKPSVSTVPWKRPGRPTKVAVKPKPPVGVKPKPRPKPTTRPSVVKPRPKPPKPVSTDEQKAARLLKLARSYEKMKLQAKFVEMLKKTVEKYPATKAAITAKTLLSAIQ
ncbi:MAG: hypothetical protein QGG42_09985 [Phycisphaerae bacterium]|jgi:hypothetical protein|nr:hypothetical protein [Phycisphaerae bacterium]